MSRRDWSWKILPTLTRENPETKNILVMLEKLNDLYGDKIESRTNTY